MPVPDWSPAVRGALEQMALATRRPARGRRAGDVRSSARGRALEFADYRPYVPGDEPRLDTVNFDTWLAQSQPSR